MSTSRQLGISVTKALLATASLAAALVVGQALTATATTALATEACPQDTHWSVVEQACVPNNPAPTDGS